MSSTPDNIILNNKPSSSITKEIAALSVTLLIHQQNIQLYLDPNCRETPEIIQNCVPFQIASSFIEFVLRQCEQKGLLWLKDHYFPFDNNVFKKEIVTIFYSSQERLNTFEKAIQNFLNLIYVFN
jgi:hypothetical protein